MTFLLSKLSQKGSFMRQFLAYSSLNFDTSFLFLDRPKTTLCAQRTKFFININIFKTFLRFSRFLDTLKLGFSVGQNHIPKWR
jgi:hypothetical protein